MPQVPDIDRLIAEVAARHGILLEKDDAAFALVTLNQLILDSAIDDLVGKMRAVIAEFEVATERVQQKAGIAIAKQVKVTVQELTEKIGSARAAPHRSAEPEFSKMPWRMLAAFALGLAVGMLVAGPW